MSRVFPTVDQIFDDLDRFRDFCRHERKVFNEADLYKDGAQVWEDYKKFLIWGVRKPSHNKRPNVKNSGKRP